MKKAWVYLENGVLLEATSFGADTTAIGRVVFNTSMIGYQEVLSDPAYADEFIVFSMPEIGNVGANDEDNESHGSYAKGVLVRSYQDRHSNFRATKSLGEFLKEHNIMGICDIDTKYLVSTIREDGILKMVASTTISDKNELKKILQSQHNSALVGTKEPYKHTHSTYSSTNFEYDGQPLSQANVVVVDFGVKEDMLNKLVASKMSTTVIPNEFDEADLIQKYNNKEIDGVFLSNGSQDPLKMPQVVSKIKKLFDAKIPLFGVGLGHHLMALANGIDVVELKSGVHGGNHPTKNTLNGSVEFFGQNSNYAIKDANSSIAKTTHINLFNHNIDGLKYNNSSSISFEFYPPLGNNNSFFGEFLNSIKR